MLEKLTLYELLEVEQDATQVRTSIVHAANIDCPQEQRPSPTSDLRVDGPNHLGSWSLRPPRHQMARITSGCCRVQSDIKKAFRRESIKWHPDKHSGDADATHRATIKFKQLNEVHPPPRNPQFSTSPRTHETVQDMSTTPLYQQHASRALASRVYGPQPHMRSSSATGPCTCRSKLAPIGACIC